MFGKEFSKTFLLKKLKLKFFACILLGITLPVFVQAQMLDDDDITPPKRPTVQSPAKAPRAFNAKPKNNAFQTRPVKSKIVEETPGDKEKPVILLYMKDFTVSRNLNGLPNCNMKFFVFTTSKEKIINLSFQLKWPQMETVVSFDNVAPNQATYLSYALGGEGCYNMDKAPNIVVNRCRIKGMSQQQCAALIAWAK